MEWGPQGIRVNGVAPWFIRTPLTEPILRGPLLELVRRRTPFRRIGECREVADAVLFLASNAASYGAYVCIHTYTHYISLWTRTHMCVFACAFFNQSTSKQARREGRIRE